MPAPLPSERSGRFRFGRFRPVDALVAVFLAVLTIFHAVVARDPAGSVYFAAVNAAVVAGIAALIHLAKRSGSRFLAVALDFYPVPMIFAVFKEVHFVIQSTSRADLDAVFIAADRWLFGGDPTVWMFQFSHPALTELMQVAYTSYYFIMIALGVELYRREERGPFRFVVFTITLGFFLSYIGYILFPGVGPRFTLHDFASTDAELPGLAVTKFLRDAINAGESIPAGAANPLALAQRDVFPSGHTQMTILTIWYAWKYSVRSRIVITVFGSLLIVSTVYLRYHYVVDLIAGAAWAAVTILAAPRLFGPADRHPGTRR